MVRKWVSWILIMALVISFGTLAACGGGDGDGKTASPTKATGTAKTTATKGTSTGGSGFTWDDIPIYPKASKVDKASFSFSGGEERNFERLEWRYYTTKDAPKDVHSFYLDKMPDNGWEKVIEMTAGQVTYSMWQKDDGNIGAWIGAGEGEKRGETMIWMWRGQGLAGEEEVEEEEPEEAEKPAASPGQSPTHTPVKPVAYSALISILPNPPAGWEADDPEGITMTMNEWAWSQATREYDNESTDEDVSVFIYDSAYYEGFAWALPFRMHFEFESSEGYGKTMTYKGFPAYEVYDAPDNYTRWISVAERYLVLVTADTKGSLEQFCGLIDYGKLANLD